MGDISVTQATENAAAPPRATLETAEAADITVKNPIQLANGNTSASKPAAKPRRPPRPNYAKIHSQPLPLPIFPLPAFVPHNPLSLLRILSALLSSYLSPPPTPKPHRAYFSISSRSVHVTDPADVRALWEAGFFGKGSLSRSEPSWMDRETARRKAGAGGTSAEATRRRREERRLFKLERARAEREAVEMQLRKEGKLGDGEGIFNAAQDRAVTDGEKQQFLETTVAGTAQVEGSKADVLDEDDEDAPLVNQEHLQLSTHEAFFLSYALGALQIQSSATDQTVLDNVSLLALFATYATFPPCSHSDLKPDNAFLLSYAVYHHFRSLGWVVRPGSKFACDWLLYNRGPVFSHAEFAVVIVPEYPLEWEGRWGTPKRRRKWWEFHCTNRVQSQVRKTLILAYVEMPLEVDWDAGDVGNVLGGFKVREFVVKRWLANRSRD